MPTVSRYLGKFCEQHKLSKDALLSSRPLKQIKSVTNGLIIELVRLRTIHRLPWRAVVDKVTQLYGKKWPSDGPSELTMIKTLSTTYKRYRNLVLKRNSSVIKQFEASLFVIPVSQLSSKLKVPLQAECYPAQPAAEQRKSLLRKEYQAALQLTITDLCKELKSTTTEVVDLKKKISKTTKIYNANRRGKRKLKRLQRQEDIIKELHDERKMMTRTLSKLERDVQANKKKMNLKLRKCRRRHNKKINRYKSRIRRLKLKSRIPVCTDSNSESESVESSDHEVEHLVDIETYDKGQYNSRVRECCMQLLASNVGIHNVETCIKAVCDLAGCKPDRLPSKSTLANMMVEAKTVSHLQIAECVPAFDSNMLHSDGTTKFGEKYGGFQVTTPESCYTLCLTTMKAGGANDFKELLTNTLSDINKTCHASERKDTCVSKRILASIKNTMSDRHIVEKKFNELLESYRAEVLPDIVEGWDSLTEDQQLSLTRMNNFFCGLHFLVGLADAAAETLKNWEALISEEDGVTEAGTLRLIRISCKAVQKQCSQQAGCHLLFKAYLESQGVHMFPIAKFQGNRFNIVFHNAAGLFYVRDHLTRYLEEMHPRRNQLLQAVLRDIKSQHHLIGCRALGLVSKCITGPLWRLLESVHSMSALGKMYQRLHRLLLKWSLDAHELLVGKGLNEEIDKNDCVFAELLKTSEDDQAVNELLQYLCKSFALVSERLLGDHLVDGTFSNMDSTTLDKEAVNLPATNVCSERDFALLDRLLREKPNCSMVAMESLILFKRNKTAAWLKTKSHSQKEKLFKTCIKIGREQRQLDKHRQQSIREHRQEVLKRREMDLVTKRKKEQEKKEQLCLKIAKEGFWNSEGKIGAGIRDQSEATRKKSLETQLRFRQHVLKQAADKSLYCMSKNRRKLLSSELAANLMTLISTFPCPPLEKILRSPQLLIGLEIQHRFEDEDGNLEWYNGLVVGFNNTEHEVIYNEESIIYHFNLFEDYSNGDLKINT